MKAHVDAIKQLKFREEVIILKQNRKDGIKWTTWR
nr:MAG TPA: hypothetical protein [Caudoviricetes sp.]